MKRLMILFVLVIMIVGVGAVVVDEVVQSDNCASGYEKASTFTDGEGKTQNLCLKKENFAEGGNYVKVSRLEIGNTECIKGESRGMFKNKAMKNVILCAEMSANESDSFVTDAYIDDARCRNGYVNLGFFSDANSGENYYCVERAARGSGGENSGGASSGNSGGGAAGFFETNKSNSKKVVLISAIAGFTILILLLGIFLIVKLSGKNVN